MDFCRLANQVWCTVEASKNKDTKTGSDASSKFHFDGSSEFHFDASSKDGEVGARLDASSNFH